MFEHAYDFLYKGHFAPRDTSYNYLHKFTFRCRNNQRYIIEVEEMTTLHLYAVKFYLKNHALSDNKYELLTHYHDASRIIRTCINVMIDLYYKDSFASFTFVGAPTPKEKKEEKSIESKRFRVYRQVMLNFFPVTKFAHFWNIENSTYLLLNVANLKTQPTLLQNVEAHFGKYYDFSAYNGSNIKQL